MFKNPRKITHLNFDVAPLNDRNAIISVYIFLLLITECEKYGTTFTMTKRVGIVGHNLDEKAGVLNNCKWRCLNAKFSCLSYEYTKNGFQHVCHLQEITWLDVTEEDRTYNDTGWFYYHRDCL